MSYSGTTGKVGSREDDEMPVYGLTSSLTVPLEGSVRITSDSVKI